MKFFTCLVFIVLYLNRYRVWDFLVKASKEAMANAGKKDADATPPTADQEGEIPPDTLRLESGATITFDHLKELTEDEGDDCFRVVSALVFPKGDLRDRYREAVSDLVLEEEG